MRLQIDQSGKRARYKRDIRLLIQDRDLAMSKIGNAERGNL